MNYIAPQMNSSIILAALESAEVFAEPLAKECISVWMQIQLTRLAWAGLLISGLAGLFAPNAVEEWCEKSVFRKEKIKKDYKVLADELTELDFAIKEMVRR